MKAIVKNPVITFRLVKVARKTPHSESKNKMVKKSFVSLKQHASVVKPIK